jgi:hypothetical protein
MSKSDIKNGLASQKREKTDPAQRPEPQRAGSAGS